MVTNSEGNPQPGTNKDKTGTADTFKKNFWTTVTDFFEDLSSLDVVTLTGGDHAETGSSEGFRLTAGHNHDAAIKPASCGGHASRH